MPIRVNCRHCGKQFSAWDNLVGQTVQCPKCKSRMIVPNGTITGGPRNDRTTEGGLPSEPQAPNDFTSLGEAVDDLPSLDELVNDFPSSAAKAGALPTFDHLSGDDPFLDETQIEAPPIAATPLAIPPVNDAAPQRPPRPLGNTAAIKPKTPVAKPADEFDDSDDLPIVCPNCNQPVPGGDEFCDACGYHRILKKVLDFDGLRRPDKTTGFERMLNQQLSEGETAQNTLLWTKVVAGLVLILLLALCMGPLYAALLCLIGLGAASAWSFLRSKNQGASSINGDPVSNAAWTALMTIQRAVGWRLLQWPFPTTQILTMNDPGFSDDDLAELKNLQTFQTLDLERTQVSNDGLVHLEGLKQLRFLVLRNTQVTPEGVQRFQAKQSSVMIWC